MKNRGGQNQFGLVGGPSDSGETDLVCVLCEGKLTRVADVADMNMYVCGCLGPVIFADVLVEIAKLPEHVSVRIHREGSAVWVSLYEDPPEGGWTSRGQYFDHPEGGPSWKEPVHDCDRHEAVIKVSTGSGLDHAITARLALSMLRDSRNRFKPRDQ